MNLFYLTRRNFLFLLTVNIIPVQQIVIYEKHIERTYSIAASICHT